MTASGDAYRERVAVVTGGGSGMGAALCDELAARGARVIVVDRVEAAAQEVVRRIESAGGIATSVTVDVCDAVQVEGLIHSVAEDWGRLDLVFNNAGVGCWGDARQFTVEQWRAIVDVNFWGCVHSTLAAYRWMADHGGGQIVNTASLAGLVPVPGTVPYAAAKHAVVGFSLSLRAEAADLGVRVNVVCPGPVRSRFHASMLVPEASGMPRQTPEDALDAPAAARAILHGAARNQAMIVFPPRARSTWWKWRIAPGLLASAHRRIVASLRG